MSNQEWMSHDEFVDKAPNSVGKIRANHDSSNCSGGRDSMIIERRADDSLSAYCFRCGMKGWKPSDDINPYKYHTTVTTAKVSLELPDDLVNIEDYNDWPVDAIMYLHQYDLYENVITVPWKFKYSKKANRIYVGKDADTWLARSLDKDNPRKWVENLGSKEEHCLLEPAVKVSGGKHLVIVEDILSGLKLRQVGCYVIVLFGSVFTTKHINLINDINPKYISVWLDNDNTKIKMLQADIRNKTGDLGYPSHIQKTSTDPKEHTYTDLARWKSIINIKMEEL